MTKYIKCEAAIKAICENCTEQYICGGSCDDTDRVRTIPPEDVVPVRHGKWLPVGVDDMDEGIYKCSECGVEQFFSGSLVDNFCPHCGVSMRDCDEERKKSNV